MLTISVNTNRRGAASRSHGATLGSFARTKRHAAIQSRMKILVTPKSRRRSDCKAPGDEICFGGRAIDLTRNRPRTIRAREKVRFHDVDRYLLVGESFPSSKGSRPRPKARFSVVVRDHKTDKQLKVEMVELPFAEWRRFRRRVNGKWAA